MTDFGTYEVDETDYNSGACAQTTTGKAIAKGEQEKSDAYFDKLYVGFWMDRNTRVNGGYPHPMVDKVEINDDFTEQTKANGCGQICNYLYNFGTVASNNANRIAVISGVPISSACTEIADLAGLINPTTLIPAV